MLHYDFAECRKLALDCPRSDSTFKKAQKYFFKRVFQVDTSIYYFRQGVLVETTLENFREYKMRGFPNEFKQVIEENVEEYEKVIKGSKYDVDYEKKHIIIPKVQTEEELNLINENAELKKQLEQMQKQIKLLGQKQINTKINTINCKFVDPEVYFQSESEEDEISEYINSVETTSIKSDDGLPTTKEIFGEDDDFAEIIAKCNKEIHEKNMKKQPIIKSKKIIEVQAYSKN